MGSFGTLLKWEVLDPAQNGQTWDPARWVFFLRQGPRIRPPTPNSGPNSGLGWQEMGSSEAYEPRAEPDPRRPLGGHGA